MNEATVTIVTYISYLNHGEPYNILLEGEEASRTALSAARKLHDNGAAIGAITQFRRETGKKTQLLTQWAATHNYDFENPKTYLSPF